MGLLDDAIRDHLDLKRRRGADPTEVDQAEQEALGPVRRDPFENAEGDLEPSAGAATAYVDEGESSDEQEYERAEERHAGEVDWDDAFDEQRAAEEPDAELPPAAVPDDEPAPEATRVLRVDELDDEEAAAFEDPAVPPPHPAGAGAETVEYDVEEAFEAEPSHEPDHEPAHPEPHPAESPREPHDGADEDVLEETPEFLQDTPDHDRLWFEQRPPKDFDFDG